MKKMWTAARFPDGSWTAGGRADDPDYACCSVYRVLAETLQEAKRKGQAEHRKALRVAAKKASEST